MYSELTGEILRTNPENGHLERLYSTIKPGVIKIGDDQPKPQHERWENAYAPIYGNEDEHSLTEVTYREI